MSALTLTPDGSALIVIPVTVDGGIEIEYVDTQIVEERYDGSKASMTVNGTNTSRRRIRIRTSVLPSSTRKTMVTKLREIGEVTADGDLLDASLVCRVSGEVTWSISEVKDFDTVEFTIEEVGS